MRVRRRSRKPSPGRVWPALVLVLALLLQGLIPAAAVAHDHGQDQIQLCTAAGLKLVSLHAVGGHDHHGFGGLACEQCVMASLAALAASPPAPIAPTAKILIAFRPAAERPSALPRAPPRPPSQGPPFQA